MLLGGALLVAFFIHLNWELHAWGRPAASFVLLSCAGMCGYSLYLGWTVMMVPEQTYWTGVFQPDTLRIFLGGLLWVVHSVLGCACLAVVSSFWCVDRGPRLLGTGPLAGGGRSIQPDALKHNWCGMAGLLVTLGVVAFATSFLPPVWNVSATNYFPNESPWSLVQGVVWTMPAPDPDFNPNGNANIIVVKLYEDVVVYFTVVGGLALLAFVGTLSPSVRRSLHSKVSLPLPAGPFFGDWNKGITRGELIGVGAVISLFIYWIDYFGRRYTRISVETLAMEDPYPSTQIAARVLGHLTTLAMSFVLFPVTHNSVWEAALGIPFERAVKYHRVMGRLVWLLVTLHMLLWQGKWAREGILWSNVFTVNNLQITAACPPSNTDDDACGNRVHFDNWTIPMAEAAWLLLTVVVIVAVACRRSRWEWFQYTHHLVWAFFAAALMHAWSNWYYVAGGLMLYFVDKVHRGVRSAREVKLLSATHAGGITVLTLDASAVLSNGHYAGQYVWLAVAGLSPTQWHPFTISSPPRVAAVDAPLLDDGDEEPAPITLHIRAGPDGTWTEGLAQMVRALAVTPGARPSDVALSLDGPYGRAGSYYERPVVVLVAGGIGFTPMHAIAMDLLHRLDAADAEGDGAYMPGDPNAPGGAVEVVHLIWLVRETSLLHVFADSLAALSASRHFVLHLYVTGTGGGRTGWGGGSARFEGGMVGGRRSSTPRVKQEEAGTEPLLAGGVGVDEDDGDEGDGESPHGDPSPLAAGLCTPASLAAIKSLPKVGRPHTQHLLKTIVADALSSRGVASTVPVSEVVSVNVCGPEPLAAHVAAISLELGTHLHIETFAL